MSIYKRGDVYWYEFVFKGERIRDTTHTGNKEAARQIEAAERVRLAKGEAGIKERVTAPTLAEFAPRFERAIETVCSDKPATISFYKEKLRRLLDDSPLSSARLDQIEEGVIDGYKQRRSRQGSRYGRPLAAASVNRELATLRRLLRLAHEWKVLDRVPRIRLLRGERNRDFVLSHNAEPNYLEAATPILRDVATLILDTALRAGEAVGLQWPDVRLQPAVHAKFGYLVVREGKSRNAKRNLSLTARVAEMLKARKANSRSAWVFPGETNAVPTLGTSLDHQHADVRAALKLPADFVIHSLRHTMLARLGEAGADSFTIMRIAGHSSVTVSQRYVYSTPESLERAFERLDKLNTDKADAVQQEEKILAAAVGAESVPTNSPTVEKRRLRKSAQIVEIKRAGP